MKIKNISNHFSFGRALTTKERKEFEEIQNDVKKLIGNDGTNILIVQDTCLPICNNDVGISNLGNPNALSFFDLMKTYMGINAIKVLPQGEIMPMEKKGGLFYSNYSSTALSLGIQNIDLERLADDKYGNILSFDDIKMVVKANNSVDNDKFTNLSNILPKNRSLKSQSETPFTKALNTAYNNFILKKPEILTKKFEEYKKQNENRLESKALYNILIKEYGNNNPFCWTNRETVEIDKNLYNKSYDEVKRKKRIQELKEKNRFEIDKYYFEQFLADEHLNENRQKLNKKNLKLFGDCLIGFSLDEVWAHPNAFEKSDNPSYPVANIGWGLPALKYSEIKDSLSDANKLLMEKVEFFAKRYDGIRFDVGWAYVSPSINNLAKSVIENYEIKHDNIYTINNLGEILLNRIESKIKEIKGEKYNPNDIIYEIEASPNDFSLFPNGNIRSEFENHKFVQSTAYEDINFATVENLKKRKVKDDGYFYMTNNHDHISLRRLSEGDEYIDGIHDDENSNLNERLEKQRLALIKELHLSENIDLKLPMNFVRAKFAQIKMAKNNKLFYMDIYGRNQEFDAQSLNSSKNYRYRIPKDYEKTYHQALQNGHGLNSMDAYQKVMEAKGLDKTNKSLYKKVKKFAKILYEKGPQTEIEANKEIFWGKNKKTLGIIGATIIAGVTLVTGGGIYLYNKKKNNINPK